MARNKAKNRNANIAQLQDALWNVGAFNKMIDKKGKKLKYLQAVDGIDGQMTQQAIEKGENKLTYGCVQLPGGKMKCLYDKYGSLTRDSVYIEPTVEGNYIYEDVDGKLKTHFAETPSNVSGSVWGSNFNINNVRYNTGY